MKKRLVSVLLALAMCMGLAVPAFATEDSNKLTVEQVDVEIQAEKECNIDTTISTEFEMILQEVAEAAENISTNKCENPLFDYVQQISDRAALSETELLDYGYSREQISLLKAYAAGELPFAEIAYATSAKLTATITATIHTATEYLLNYRWEWDIVPTGTGVDSAALGVIGINSQSMAFVTNFSSPNAYVEYYYSDGNRYRIESLSAKTVGSGVSTNYASYKMDDNRERWVWAKRGNLSVRVTPTVSGQTIFSAVKARGELGHVKSSGVSINSVEILGNISSGTISIKFNLSSGSSQLETLGVRQYVFYNDGSIVQES